jgi:polyhydroxyalkanoate synthase subunit PhaC
MDAAMNAWRQAQYSWTDVLRRAQGDAFAALGLGPDESRYRVVAAGSHWRLRDYAEQGGAPALLIIAAPIKRPYIWDLAPSVSAIRYCLQRHFHVYLLEWLPAARDSANKGLEEYTDAICECVKEISRAAANTPLFLIGHSLGGTLSAIFAASARERPRGLVLLGAPLSFEPETSHFRDALVSLVPSTFSETDTCPGSLLSHMSALASPGTFIWSRLMDAAFSISDRHALDIHARVERWALDEVPLPGKLVQQIIEWLYRENRFCRGTLKVGRTFVGPSSLSIPTLAVLNTADEVASLTSIKPFTDAMPAGYVRIIEYLGEVGTCLQHLGILVGREAYARVWPEIIAWLDSRD